MATAPHIRRVIRQGFVDVLKDARTAAGSNVSQHPFNDRIVTKSIVVEDLGAKHSEGNVTEVQATLSEFDDDVERRYRICTIVEIKGGPEPQDARDDLVGEVEAALMTAAAAGDLPGVKALRLAGYTADDDNTGDQPIRRGLQVFEATYITPGADPTTTL
jgi:hypothetical protein